LIFRDVAILINFYYPTDFLAVANFLDTSPAHMRSESGYMLSSQPTISIKLTETKEITNIDSDVLIQSLPEL